MSTGKTVTYLCAAAAFVIGFVLMAVFSFPIGCFLVALGFVFVAVAEGRGFYLGATVFWIVFGVAVGYSFGWYAHLP